MPKTSPSEAFEIRVAELYRTLGYEVERNPEKLGHQVDIVLTYPLPGGLPNKTAVECKYIRHGNLRKNAAMENINAFADLKRNQEVENLVIVTTNGFSKDLFYSAEKNRIKLLTIRDLEHQVARASKSTPSITFLGTSEKFYEACTELVKTHDRVLAISKYPILVLPTERELSTQRRVYYAAVLNKFAGKEDGSRMKYLFDSVGFRRIVEQYSKQKNSEKLFKSARTMFRKASRLENLHMRCTKTGPFVSLVIGEPNDVCIGFRSGKGKKHLTEGVKIHSSEFVHVLRPRFKELFRQAKKDVDEKYLDDILREFQ